MQNYNFNCGTVIKYLRKVLEEINRNNINSGIKTAFVMKRFIEEYKIDRVEFKEHEELSDDDKLKIKKIPKNEAIGQKLVLLCMLKDIGTFYRDMEVPIERTRYIDRLLASFVFFTRLPFWRLAQPPKECYSHVVEHWPLVGWLTGGVMALVLYFGSWLLPWPVR